MTVGFLDPLFAGVLVGVGGDAVALLRGSWIELVGLELVLDGDWLVVEVMKLLLVSVLLSVLLS